MFLKERSTDPLPAIFSGTQSSFPHLMPSHEVSAQLPPAMVAGKGWPDDQSSPDSVNVISGESRQEAISTSAAPLKRQKVEEPIAFTEEDAQGVQFPHNDVVVVSLNIADYDVRRILVDNGSSADILFYSAFSRMAALGGHLRPMCSPLIGFTGDAIPTEGTIALTVIRVSIQSSLEPW